MLYRQRKVRLDAQRQLRKDSSLFDQHTELSKAQMAHHLRSEKLHEARLRLLVPHNGMKHDSDVEAEVSPVLIFKVFFSALQVLSLAKRFEFEWPGFLKSVFVVQSSATGGNTFALDCFFPNTIPIIYERVLLMVSMSHMFCSVALCCSGSTGLYASCPCFDRHRWLGLCALPETSTATTAFKGCT